MAGGDAAEGHRELTPRPGGVHHHGTRYPLHRGELHDGPVLALHAPAGVRQRPVGAHEVLGGGRVDQEGGHGRLGAEHRVRAGVHLVAGVQQHGVRDGGRVDPLHQLPALAGGPHAVQGQRLAERDVRHLLDALGRHHGPGHPGSGEHRGAHARQDPLGLTGRERGRVRAAVVARHRRDDLVRVLRGLAGRGRRRGGALTAGGGVRRRVRGRRDRTRLGAGLGLRLRALGALRAVLGPAGRRADQRDRTQGKESSAPCAARSRGRCGGGDHRRCSWVDVGSAVGRRRSGPGVSAPGPQRPRSARAASARRAPSRCSHIRCRDARSRPRRRP